MKAGLKEGATLLCGGESAGEGGCFLKLTLLGDVTNDMRVPQEEIFGPAACIIWFKSKEEVIEAANNSDYGLGGAV